MTTIFIVWRVCYGFPPKVVLLRTGNQSTKFIAELLTQHVDDILSLLNSDELGVLELY